MAKAKKKEALSLEEILEQALVPVDEQQYEVPENWCWTYLRNIAQWGSGGTPSRKHPAYYEGNIPWVKTGELEDGYLYDTEEKISDEAVQKSSAKLFPVESVLIAMYGATIGKTAILGVEATTNQACACAICNESVYNKYLFYYLRSQKDSFIEQGKGGAQPNISQDIIKRNTIPLPPKAEQQRIVEQIERLFTKLDEAKEQAQSVLDNSEEKKSAILFKAYSGALTKEWRKQNGKCQDEWQEVRLKDVCKINPPKINAKDYDDDMEVSFFPMPALSEITGTITEPQTRKLGEVKTGFTNFSEGDVVFAKITPCMENGKSAIIGKLVNDIGYGTTEFYVMRCSNKLSNGYLYHLVRSKHFRDEAKSVMTGAVGQQRVPKSFLEEYELKLPPIEEQEEILKIVDAMVSKEHRVAVNCENVIEQIDMMKKSILARAFRGELGTNNLDEESAVELLKQIITENL